MQIILVPDKDGKKSHHTCLTTRFVLGLALTSWLVLPLVVGAGAYQIGANLTNLRTLTVRQQAEEPHDLAIESESVAQLRQAVRDQMHDIEEIRSAAESHFDAVGLRLGGLQAQVMRINALGERLTALAGLDDGEFDFDVPPPLGGPAASDQLGDLDHSDLVQSLDDLSMQAKVSHAQLEVLETLLMERDLQREIEPVGWPSEGGWISSSYGYRRDPFTGRKAFHNGVDIANKAKAKIKAIGGGIVTIVRDDPGYGTMVEVSHGNGYVTRYAHLLEANVGVGRRVERGDAIGIVGSTGRSTGIHLHFELLRGGKPVNPRNYLKIAG